MKCLARTKGASCSSLFVPLLIAFALPACEMAKGTVSVSEGKREDDVLANLTPDPSKISDSMHIEQQAVLALVPDDQATARAARDGAWTDPETWGGNLPEAGAKIVIPESISVRYDGGEDTPPVNWLRVDGTLSFERYANTRLTVDTLVVGLTGTLAVGTREAPIEGFAEIVFAGDSPVETGPDRPQFERGIVNLGATTLSGQTKTAFVALRDAPRRGAERLQLANAPEGWREGDRVVLTGTHYAKGAAREDETRTLVAIDGATLTLDEPLAHDHVLPADSGVAPYVANLTRNVRVASAEREILQRGHVMFMHSDQVDVHAVEFDDLGRTNKEIYADDPDPGPNGRRLEGEGYASPMTGTNVRGRYAVHLHRTGIKPERPCIAITDSVVEGSPGWGFVNHGSYGCIRDNVAHDVLGSAFVSEAGTEIGDFTRNLAVGSNGSDPARADDGPHRDTALLDMWHEGIGFGMRSNAVALIGNVATDQAADGFSWDGWDPESFSIPAAALPVQGIARSRPSIAFTEQPLLEFVDNVSIANKVGARLDGMGTVMQSGTYDVIARFTAINSGSRGIVLRYSQTILREVRLVNDEPSAASTVGISLGPTSPDYSRVQGEHALNDVRVRGFGLGIDNTEPMRTEDAPHPSRLVAMAVDLDGNGRDLASDDRVERRNPPAGDDDARLDAPDRLEIVNAGSGLYFRATVEDAIGAEELRFDYSAATVNARIAAGYYGSDQDPYVLLALPVTDRASGRTKTVQVRAHFEPALFDEHGELLADEPPADAEDVTLTDAPSDQTHGGSSH